METKISKIPEVEEIQAAYQKIAGRIVNTPVWQWQSQAKEQALGSQGEVWIKMELLQRGGSFKPRGALINMMQMDPAALQRGVTAVSAGNHAIAVAIAAQLMGSSAKVVMPANANPYRVQKCQALGAEVVLVANVTEAFAKVEAIRDQEGRTFIHPFDGHQTVLGTATVGWEFAHQVPELDALIVPIGGGGLAAGMASAFHRLQPRCRLYGVEPVGADSMSRSFAAGKPASIERVATIADSLGAPFALEHTFRICQELLEKIVLIEDDALRTNMELMFTDMKLAAEPACAASLTALLGPLAPELRDKKVGIIACGSNIDLNTFWGYLR